MFSLQSKITFNSVILILLLLATAGYALHAMNRVGSELATIAEQDIPLTRTVSKVVSLQLQQAIHFERAVRHGLGGRTPEAVQHFDRQVDEFTARDKRFDQFIETAMQITDASQAHADNAMTTDKFSQVREQLLEIAAQHSAYSRHAREAFAALRTGGVDGLDAMIAEIEREEDELDSRVEKLLEEIQSFTAMATERAAGHEVSAIRFLSGLSLAGIILGIAISFYIIRSTIRPIRRVTGAMNDIASGDGDLTRRLEIDDAHEIGAICRAFNQFAAHTHGIMLEVSNSSNQLAASAEELSTITRDLSQNTDTTKIEIEQVATAMNEMSATVNEVAMNAAHVVEAAGNADTEAGNGNTVVRDVIRVIQSLADNINQSSSVIADLDQQSDSISVVLDVIKNISEQTNLLALNAAIEAARAGEHGRGFAVVAEEVRSLAAKTQDSAGQIEEMIARLQEGAKDAVASMNTSHEYAQQSVDKANEAGGSLAGITRSVSTINDMNTQIATAAEEQSSVAEKINRNVTNIHDTAYTAAAAGQQTAAASQELASLAENLSGLVSKFRL